VEEEEEEDATRPELEEFFSHTSLCFSWSPDFHFYNQEE
jgi:hypothetical protein